MVNTYLYPMGAVAGVDWCEMPYCPGDPEEGLTYDMEEGEQYCGEDQPQNKCVRCEGIFCAEHFDPVKKMCPRCKRCVGGSRPVTELKRARVQPFRVLILGRTIGEERRHGWLSTSTFRERFRVDAGQPIEVTMLDSDHAHAVAREHSLPEVGTHVTPVHGSFPFDFQLEHKYDVIMNDWSTLKLMWEYGFTPAALRWLIAPGGQLFLCSVHNVYEERRVLLNTTEERCVEAAKRCGTVASEYGGVFYDEPVLVNDYPGPTQHWFVNVEVTTVEDFVITAFVVPLFKRMGKRIPPRWDNKNCILMVDGKKVSTHNSLHKSLSSIGITMLCTVASLTMSDSHYYFNDIDVALVHEGFLPGVFVAGSSDYPLLHWMEPCEEYGVWYASDTTHGETALWSEMYHRREHDVGSDCPGGPSPTTFTLLCM